MNHFELAVAATLRLRWGMLPVPSRCLVDRKRRSNGRSLLSETIDRESSGLKVDLGLRNKDSLAPRADAGLLFIVHPPGEHHLLSNLS